jgi:hypothetical protein
MVVMLRATYLSLVLAAAVATLAEESKAFQYEVDYFRVVGNLPVDQTDHFDDGVLTGWEHDWDRGTAIEQGGAAILMSPGEADSFPVGGQLIFGETSDIRSNDFNISLSGAGNATATSRWMPNVIPQTNQLYGMSASLEFFDGGSNHVGFEDFYLNIGNVASDLGGLFGMTEGLYITFSREKHGPDGYSQEMVFSSISLSSDDDMVLRLVFDEAGYQFQASFSVDGGATFQDPGLAWGIESLGPIADSLGATGVFSSWGLTAMSLVVPEPTTAVPSLSPVGVALLGGLILALGMAAAGRRRTAA